MIAVMVLTSLLREGISKHPLVTDLMNPKICPLSSCPQSAEAILECARILLPNRKKIYGNGSIAAVRNANSEVAHCHHKQHLVLANPALPAA